MSKKVQIAEDTKASFKSGVLDKVNKADKPQKLPGEVEEIIPKAIVKPDQKMPSASRFADKDKSINPKVKVSAGEQNHETMNNMPMVKKLDEENSEKEFKKVVFDKLVEAMEAHKPENTKVDLKEHTTAMFEGTDGLTDEFKTKATTIFETAVNAEVTNKFTTILEAAVEVLIAEETLLVEAYDEKIQDALISISEHWLEANKIALQPKLKTQITESFMTDLKKLMIEHNIDMPDEKVDVVESLTEKIMNLENSLNEALESNISLSKKLNEEKLNEVVDNLAKGLADTQAAKFKNLCNELAKDDEFEAKAKQIRESYFKEDGLKVKRGNADTAETVLTEEENDAQAKTINEEVKVKSDARTSAYVSALSRFSGKK